MTVAELIEHLSKVEDKRREVSIFVPGATINLHSVAVFTVRKPPADPVLILGDVAPNTAPAAEDFVLNHR